MCAKTSTNSLSKSMAKRKHTYIILLISLFIVYVGVEVFRPKPVDWSPNFGANGKMPYGCYILRQKLPELLQDVTVSDNTVDFYRTLNDEQPDSSTLCVITDDFSPATTDLKSLLLFVEEGNCAFISAQNFGGRCGDTLNVETDYRAVESVDAVSRLELQMVNANVPGPRKFTFDKISSYYFSSVDTANTVVLETDSVGRATYVRTRFGEGYFFLHANPLVLTNYHILYSSPGYPARCLAYLAGRPLLWDEYYKPGQMRRGGASPLRYVLAQEPLKYAYILFVLTWLVFVFFMGKRKQRMVPVHEKPKNQSLDFIETVGQLYFSRRNNSDIVRKKIAHFADYVQSVFYLKFRPEDAAFRRDFAAKANLPADRVDRLFDTLVRLQRADDVTDGQLMAFIAEIDQFQYQNA